MIHRLSKRQQKSHSRLKIEEKSDKKFKHKDHSGTLTCALGPKKTNLDQKRLTSRQKIFDRFVKTIEKVCFGSSNTSFLR